MVVAGGLTRIETKGHRSPFRCKQGADVVFVEMTEILVAKSLPHSENVGPR